MESAHPHLRTARARPAGPRNRQDHGALPAGRRRLRLRHPRHQRRRRAVHRPGPGRRLHHAGQSLDVTGPAGWNCAGPVSVPGSLPLPPGTPPIPPGTTSVACGNPNATIAPGDPPLEFKVQVPAGQQSKTGWRNCAAVVGDPAKETNYGNNRSASKTPTSPKQPDEKPDLKVEKRLSGCTGTAAPSRQRPQPRRDAVHIRDRRHQRRQRAL